MRSAPAVTFPVGRSRSAVILPGVILGAGALALMTWLFQSQAIGPRHLSAWLVWLIAAVLAWHHWANGPKACLMWDGEQWAWGDADVSVTVVPHVILDLQQTLLLCLSIPKGRTFWIWPERHMSDHGWLPLRRAIFCPGARDRGDDHRA